MPDGSTSLLAGLWCIFWASFVKRNFRDSDDEPTFSDEWRGFIMRLARLPVLWLGIVLLLNGLVRFIVSVSN